ncbi:MAG: AI-2E family transporter [Lachnospiraceae bacterium]|nr:AI-2E family transporter [Lachnospiraceae bacterium]
MHTPENRREIGKWIIGIITCCILIYITFEHLTGIIGVVLYLVDLIKPFLIGVILALVLNVPMSAIERLLKKKTFMKKGIRALSIVLALILIVAILILVAVLVVPELLRAVRLIVQIIGNGLNGLDALEDNAALMETPIGEFLAGFDIDWLGLKAQLDEFISANSGEFVNQAISVTGAFVSSVVTFVVALVFSIYILASKEKLKRQACRLVRVWLPGKIGEPLIHVCAVCSSTFQSFIGGQVTEAIILGTLCMIGMLILRIPYAAMVGALVGVTAIIPIVGAYVSAIIGAIMILTVSPIKALIFLIYIIVLQQLENNLIYPRIVGTKINLPAMWVLAAVYVGGNLGGPIGMLLGVPATSAAYSLLKEATGKREKYQQ